MHRLVSGACFAALLLLAAQPALAASDARMQILVTPDETLGITLQSLQTNIAQAADMALPRLWARIVPQQAQKDIPKKVKAIRFLQRAVPGDNGIMIVFQPRRVFGWLKTNNIPYIEQAPAWNLSITLHNAAGRGMPVSANLLRSHAGSIATDLGYILDSSAPVLVLDWRWLDSSRVSLSVRGGSRLGEYTETRRIPSGDPAQELQPWLDDVLRKARDAYVKSAAPVAPVPAIAQQASAQSPATALTGIKVAAPSAQNYLLLDVQRHASLPEQILFEQDLRQDPRILDLSLRQVTRGGQQYRLHLKGSDDMWLRNWLSRRGLTLTPTIEGWVARQQTPAR